MRLVGLILLIAVLSAPVALADGKTTEDPNQAEAAATAVQEDASDARLAQKVTYEAKKKPVLDVLTELAEKTGVTFRVGKSSQDWQVRDRKVNIYAKDVPLSRLMSSVARALKMKWIKSEDEKPTYRLVADSRAMKEAEAELARIEQEREQRLTERRQKALEALTKTQGASDADLAKLRKDNPFLYYCAQTGLSQSMGGFFKEVPGALDALMHGQAMNMSATNLSPAAQQAIVGTMKSLNNLEGRFGHKRDLPANIAGNVGSATISVNAHMDEMRMMPGNGFMLGSMEFRVPDGDGGQRTEMVPLIDPNSKFAEIIGKALVKCDEEGRSMDELGKEMGAQMQAEMLQAMTSELKTEEPQEKPAEHADDPELTKKIKTEGFAGQSLDDLMPMIAAASEFAVVSDSFGIGIAGRLNKPTFDKEMETKAVLEKVGESYRYSWDKHGPIIELWDKQWAKKIAAMVPEAWLERWRDCLKKGTFDIGELAEMASLTQEQFSTNLLGDPELASMAWESRRNREGLQIYAGLNDAQRQMLFSEAGLDLRNLGPELWALVEKSLTAKNASFLTNPDARLTVLADKRETDGERRYSFRIQTSEGLPEVSWSVGVPTTKKAEEPAKQVEKPK